MKTYNYRLYPVLFLAFLKVAASITLELAVPIYFIQERYDIFIIGLLVSASAMTYLFSPILLRDVYSKIGIKKTLIISVLGSLIIQIILQFSLNPWVVYILLLSEGMLLGLFWPVLMTDISIISNMGELCEIKGFKDKLAKNYNLAWNLGAIFSYLIGVILLNIIEDITLMFKVTLIYSIILVFFTISFENPKQDLKLEKKIIIDKKMVNSCIKERVGFPISLPFFLIGFYGFLIGSVILLYSIKSEMLGFEVFTIYLFNFFRMSAQALSIAITTKFPIKTLKKLLIISLFSTLLCFIIFGINDNIIIFGILFFIFGTFGAMIYTFSFKLSVYENMLKNTAKYSSYFETSFGLGYFLAPLIGGFIAEININLAFYFLAILNLISFLIYISLKTKIKTENT
jgi:MFS family permease